MTDAHVETETLHVAVDIPEHAARALTPLFARTRKLLIERDKGCEICGATESLQAHHHPIERCLMDMIDWERFAADCKAGVWGPHAQAFDWSAFDATDPTTFVDDMTVNGELLCEKHHIGADEGKHMLPYPLWIAQRYGKDGYRFSGVEVLHQEGDK